jgi:hypothetical protein
MVDDILKTKVTGRKVCDDNIFKGTSPVLLPNPKKESEINRHLIREEEANWKIVCLGGQTVEGVEVPCGEIKYLNTMNIEEVNAVVQFWHPGHRKALYNRVTMGNQSYRGTIPAMEECLNKRTGGKVG